MKYIFIISIIILLLVLFSKSSEGLANTKKNSKKSKKNSKKSKKNSKKSKKNSKKSNDVDCVMSPWSDWIPSKNKCSKPCGGGFKILKATRKVITPAKGNGKKCPTQTTNYKKEQCNDFSCNECVKNEKGRLDCNIDCKVANWTEWEDTTQCNATCGGGTKTQTRTKPILQESRNKGRKCPEKLIETKEVECNTQGCPIDCVEGDWSDWSNITECSKECDGGMLTQERTRNAIVESANGGRECILRETQNIECNKHACDGVLDEGEWSEWKNITECDSKCNGKLTQERSKLNYISKLGDTKCEEEKQTQELSCNVGNCGTKYELYKYGTSTKLTLKIYPINYISSSNYINYNTAPSSYPLVNLHIKINSDNTINIFLVNKKIIREVYYKHFSYSNKGYFYSAPENYSTSHSKNLNYDSKNGLIYYLKDSIKYYLSQYKYTNYGYFNFNSLENINSNSNLELIQVLDSSSQKTDCKETKNDDQFGLCNALCGDSGNKIKLESYDISQHPLLDGKQCTAYKTSQVTCTKSCATNEIVLKTNDGNIISNNYKNGSYTVATINNHINNKPFYYEDNSDGTFYIYYMDGTSKKYLSYNTSTSTSSTIIIKNNQDSYNKKISFYITDGKLKATINRKTYELRTYYYIYNFNDLKYTFMYLVEESAVTSYYKSLSVVNKNTSTTTDTTSTTEGFMNLGNYNNYGNRNRLSFYKIN